jgi:hypothetical protein
LRCGIVAATCPDPFTFRDHRADRWIDHWIDHDRLQVGFGPVAASITTPMMTWM